MQRALDRRWVEVHLTLAPITSVTISLKLAPVSLHHRVMTGPERENRTRAFSGLRPTSHSCPISPLLIQLPITKDEIWLHTSG
jgi:hypothetical protein